MIERTRRRVGGQDEEGAGSGVVGQKMRRVCRQQRQGEGGCETRQWLHARSPDQRPPPFRLLSSLTLPIIHPSDCVRLLGLCAT